MRTVAVIIGKDLRLRLRDRSAIIIAFIAPFVLALIISSAFGGGGGSFNADFAVADEDGGGYGKSLVDGVKQNPVLSEGISFRVTGSEAEARKLATEGDVSAAIVFPAGFTRAVEEGQAGTVQVYAFAGSRIGADVATALAERMTEEINAGRLAVQTAMAAGIPATESLASLVQKASAAAIPLAILDGKLGTRQVEPSSYFGPSMSIFFVFFTVQFGALSLLQERANGTFRRIAAAPVSPWSVIVGKIGSSFLLGIASLAVMIAATTLLLDASWGDPVAVGAICVAIVLAASSVTALAISLARTVEQAQGFASIVTLVLSMLGGNFIPIGQSPKLMQDLSKLTPNGWAIKGFTDLVADGGGVSSVGPHLAAIMAFAIVCGAVAWTRARKLVSA